MKREIKFRVWDGVNMNLPETGKPIKLYSDGSGTLEWYTGEEICKIKTLMQYTGLKDKNGVEIYEGDICIVIRKGYLSGNFEGVGKIEYYYDRFRWNSEDMNYDEQSDVWPHIDLFAGPTEIEVIGNIYENPELCQ